MMPDRHGQKDLLVSVLIPTYQEEAVIGGTLAHTRRVIGRGEIIVVDGHSSDRTALIADYCGARVVHLDKPRGAALNDAATIATGDVLIFLHADTLLPLGAVDAIAGALADAAVVGGAFRFSFDERRWGPRAIAAWVNLRSSLLNVFFGDQALFVRRDVFMRSGGFKDWSVMDDLEILHRLRRFGALRMVAPAVLTSARRHRARGWVRTLATVWALTGLYLLGVSGETLGRLYKPQR